MSFHRGNLHERHPRIFWSRGKLRKWVINQRNHLFQHCTWTPVLETLLSLHGWTTVEAWVSSDEFSAPSSFWKSKNKVHVNQLLITHLRLWHRCLSAQMINVRSRMGRQPAPTGIFKLVSDLLRWFSSATPALEEPRPRAHWQLPHWARYSPSQPSEPNSTH